MFSRIRSRIGSAHVIAVVALVMAVTGTSIALPGNNSVDSGDIRKNAVTTNDIRNSNVKKADLAASAVTTGKIKDGNVIGADVSEGSLGTVPTAAKANNVSFAVVANPGGPANATLARSSAPAPTVVEANGVQVVFNRDVSGCAYSVSKSNAGSMVEMSGFAQASTANGNVNAVDVRTRDDAGNLVDGDFHLVVVCPS